MKSLTSILMLAVACLAGGCSKTDPLAGSAAAPAGQQYLLPDEPAGALSVIDAAKDAKENEQIVVVGRIGGDPHPWIDALAAFTIVDVSLKPCNDIPGDTCETPWDYCCELNTLPSASATVKIVSENGEPVAVGAKKLLGLKELQTVVVRGKAHRDPEGGLSILASDLFVRK